MIKITALKTDLSFLNSTYKELAELIGYDNMEKLYHYYKGQSICFPTRIFDHGYILNVIKNEYDGTNAKVLARKLSYSERWIKQLAKELENR